MKLLYPNTLKLNVSDLEGFSVGLHCYDARAPTMPEEHLDADVLVTWSNAAANLQDAASKMKNLRWVQSLSAGTNDVEGAGFDSKVVITSGSGLHDWTVAEHSLGMLLNAARRFYEMRDYQNQCKWPGHLGGPQPDRPEGAFTTLRDARVTIWGFGNIAKTLAPWLLALGADVKGVARSRGVRAGVEVYGEDSLPELLPNTDVLLMILPGSDVTRHSLNAARLKKLPKHAWVCNVGRGICVDEEALADALDRHEIGGAALDVFATEPLPERESGSRLWKAPNVIVSPHAAGGRPQGAEELITSNLRRFIAGQTLRNVVRG